MNVYESFFHPFYFNIIFLHRWIGLSFGRLFPNPILHLSATISILEVFLPSPVRSESHTHTHMIGIKSDGYSVQSWAKFITFFSSFPCDIFFVIFGCMHMKTCIFITGAINFISSLILGIGFYSCVYVYIFVCATHSVLCDCIVLFIWLYFRAEQPNKVKTGTNMYYYYYLYVHVI